MKIKIDTIIRTVVLIVALVNQGLTMAGINILPITDEQISEIITLVFTVGAALWAWWKNNSFTPKALEADAYLEDLRKGVTDNE